MHVLVTRPEPDALKLKGVLEQRGHRATATPLLAVAYDGLEAEELEGVTTLVATSRHGLRALVGTAALEAARALTVIAVGAATAEEARRMGFARVVKGPGTAADLGPMIAAILDPMEEVLLHLAGERLAADLAGELQLMGFRVAARPVYRMEPASALPAGVVADLAKGRIDAVLLMSPQTAAVWVRLVKRHQLVATAGAVAHLCLSEAVAARLAGLGPVPTLIANAPSLEEMLALVEVAAANSEA